jgi:hypothetical protein
MARPRFYARTVWSGEVGGGMKGQPAQRLRSDLVKWKKVRRQTGIKPD